MKYEKPYFRMLEGEDVIATSGGLGPDGNSGEDSETFPTGVDQAGKISAI